MSERGGQRIPLVVWDPHKDEIHKLYIEQGLTPGLVMKTMYEKYGFTASVSQYKAQLARWGLNKNAKRSEASNDLDRDSEREIELDAQRHNRMNTEGAVRQLVGNSPRQLSPLSHMRPGGADGNMALHASSGDTVQYATGDLMQPSTCERSNMNNSGTWQDLLPEGYLRCGPHARPPATALQAACPNGHLSIVRTLLEHGANPNAPVSPAGNALTAAVASRQISIVRLLLEAGAEVNVGGDSFATPLSVAAFQGHVQLIRLLLQVGADINGPCTYFGTPLLAAASKGHGQVVDILLDHGADVNASSTNLRPLQAVQRSSRPSYFPPALPQDFLGSKDDTRPITAAEASNQITWPTQDSSR
ncbi:uncharacterized protein HMPREF1541_09792 [Cyphellophora europaea CBS 101466]|uniref:Clr5 domain-containing protein n=1 Tax=Cyphellophora europaea (strain CBS 101466) TaxID=1220924 RepID=W2S8C8_CYPE1|nr:uncharacterized protein HMPREF1541_09792 [Cyphellophora europaea CBS 101466]ETN44917.1 hypothetical protein HMPREF1541_09792 [Cyphellophora europaea CBS 101466]